ncbi:MAG: replicative DNA helicase [Candidatus Omnitrophica bacterium]|nr:replicative DNA helicase [Candidatus Omnitrophota bacterium]
MNELQEAIQREKVPPQNVEAEIAVLGSMLIEEDAIAQGIELLAPEAFYKDAHQKIFQSVINLFNENRAVDLITLTEALTKDGNLDGVGGASYLAYLTSAVPTAANLLYYAKIVKEKYILRHLISSATRIVTDSFDTTQDVDALLDRSEKLIFDITSRKFSGGVVPLKEIIRKQIDAIDKLFQRKGQVTGIATGFHEFDVMTAGLQPSDLVVIAARPSMGKSALMTCVAEHAGVVLKVPTAIFSNAPIYIDDTPGLSALELKAKARRLKAQFDVKLIMVDYLQLMQGPQGSESRQQEISEISRSLKALARELHVPLIAVSQLSRAVESRSDHRPQLSDLRESGAIEQDADVVVLLLREEYYHPTDENRGKAEVIVAKQRNGPVGSFKLAFIHEYTRFENAELARQEEMG